MSFRNDQDTAQTSLKLLSQQQKGRYKQETGPTPQQQKASYGNRWISVVWSKLKCLETEICLKKLYFLLQEKINAPSVCIISAFRGTAFDKKTAISLGKSSISPGCKGYFPQGNFTACLQKHTNKTSVLRMFCKHCLSLLCTWQTR